MFLFVALASAIATRGTFNSVINVGSNFKRESVSAGKLSPIATSVPLLFLVTVQHPISRVVVLKLVSGKTCEVKSSVCSEFRVELVESEELVVVFT